MCRKFADSCPAPSMRLPALSCLCCQHCVSVQVIWRGVVCAGLRAHPKLALGIQQQHRRRYVGSRYGEVREDQAALMCGSLS